MARITLVFGPADVAHGSGRDGVALRFRFGSIRRGEGARRDEMSHHSVRVGASSALLAAWKLGDASDKDPRVVETLFQFALDEVRSSFAEARFPQVNDVALDTHSQPQTYPFDAAKLVSPNGHTLEIDEDALDSARTEDERARRRIGLEPKEQEEAGDADA